MQFLSITFFLGIIKSLGKNGGRALKCTKDLTDCMKNICPRLQKQVFFQLPLGLPIRFYLFLQPCIYHKDCNWRKGNQRYIFTHVAQQSDFASHDLLLLSTYFKHSDYLLMPCTLIILHLDAPRDHNSRPKYVNCVQSCFANLYQNPMKDRTKKQPIHLYAEFNLNFNLFHGHLWRSSFCHLPFGFQNMKILHEMNWLKLSAQSFNETKDNTVFCAVIQSTLYTVTDHIKTDIIQNLTRHCHLSIRYIRKKTTQ